MCPKHSPPTQQHFDPNTYCIVYEELMDNKEARRVFQDFLQQQRNDAPLLFLDSFANYENSYQMVLKEVFGGWQEDGEEKLNLERSAATKLDLKQTFRNEVIGRVDYLMSTFFEYSSEHELNVGSNQGTLLKLWKLVNDELIQTYVTATTTTKTTTTGQDKRNSHDCRAESRLSYCESSGGYLSVEQLESMIMFRLDPMTLFGNVLSVIHLDLKMDQFSRFVRSEKLNAFLKLKGESFTRSIGYDISKGFKVDLRFKPNDLKEQVINDDHIYFGFTLAEDTPDWKMIYSRKDLCCFSSNTTYFFGDSKGMKLLKAVMYLPFSFEDVISMIYNSDLHDGFDSQTSKDGFILQSYMPPSGLNNVGGGGDQGSGGGSSYATQCMSVSVDLSLPFIKKRQLPCVLTTIIENDLSFQVLHTAEFSNEEMPKHKNQVLADSLSYFFFYRVSSRLTRIIHVTYSDLALPFQTDFLFETFWKKRATSLFDGMTKMLNLITNNGTTPADESKIVDDHKHRQAMNDNSKAFPNRSWYKEWLERSKKKECIK